MENSRIAVKAFIVNNKNELLLIKRSDDDLHTPGVWEIPGGRLDMGENPFTGLQRETKEETGLDIEIMNPLDIHYFMRDDGQKITMLIFYCRPITNDVVLSDEHTDYMWIPVDKAVSKITPKFQVVVRLFQKHFYKKNQ